MKDERTYKIIGASMEVHKELGCGFLEAVYQEALEREFKIQRIPFKSQPVVEIIYKNEPLEQNLLNINVWSMVFNSLIFNLRKSAPAP
jgi:GxxExxY protein